MTQVWTIPDIKAALAKKGYTLAALDRLSDGQEPPFYSGAARHGLRGTNYRAAALIAQVLGLPMSVLFPGQYLNARPGTAPGAPSLSQTGAHASSQSGAAASDNARAA